MRNLLESAAVFDEIYELYADDIYRLCFTYMKNKMDAEDAMQETFYRFYTTQRKFDSIEHIKAWVIVTASNYCKDILKQWWRKRKNLDEIGEVASEEKTENSELYELVMKLPEKYKAVTYMYYYEGYNSRQIARILGKPESTVRTYLQKARQQLKQEIE